MHFLCVNKFITIFKWIHLKIFSSREKHCCRLHKYIFIAWRCISIYRILNVTRNCNFESYNIELFFVFRPGFLVWPCFVNNFYFNIIRKNYWISIGMFSLIKNLLNTIFGKWDFSENVKNYKFYDILIGSGTFICSKTIDQFRWHITSLCKLCISLIFNLFIFPNGCCCMVWAYMKYVC